MCNKKLDKNWKPLNGKDLVYHYEGEGFNF
jgi:hypothetical protein